MASFFIRVIRAIRGSPFLVLEGAVTRRLESQRYGAKEEEGATADNADNADNADGADGEEGDEEV